MRTALQPDELLVKEGEANLQQKIETVGGRLYLTNRRLIFESHIFNFQRGTTEVALSAIQSARPCWTRFLNVFPLLPNSLAVLTKQGAEHRFVLFGRDAWAAAIEAQRAGEQDSKKSAKRVRVRLTVLERGPGTDEDQLLLGDRPR